MRTRMARFAWTAGAVCLVAAGCAPPKTTVTGTVRFRGRPVTWGSITLVSGEGISYPGAIQADGSFAIPGVPVGAVKVGVQSQNPGGGRAADPALRPGGRVTRRASEPAPIPKPAPLAWFPIPDKYADPERSGLTAEIRDGQPVTIDLQ